LPYIAEGDVRRGNRLTPLGGNAKLRNKKKRIFFFVTLFQQLFFLKQKKQRTEQSNASKSCEATQSFAKAKP